MTSARAGVPGARRRAAPHQTDGGPDGRRPRPLDRSPDRRARAARGARPPLPDRARRPDRGPAGNRPVATRRTVEAIDRLGGGAACRHFYDEHIEADAVHEQVMRRDVIRDLPAREPGLTADVVLGIRATALLDGRLEEHLLGAWRAGRASLRTAPGLSLPSGSSGSYGESAPQEARAARRSGVQPAEQA